MRTPPGWKLCMLLLVVAAHAWLGWALANYRPDGKLDRTRAREIARTAEVLLVLEFKTRVAPAQGKRPLRRSRSAMAASVPELAFESGNAAGPVPAESGRALDLRPAPLPKAEFGHADPLRHASALSYEATRYDGAWISTGNLTEVAARRSVVANVVLSVLGALRKECTEKQRANYDRACVTEQYEYKPEIR